MHLIREYHMGYFSELDINVCSQGRGLKPSSDKNCRTSCGLWEGETEYFGELLSQESVLCS